MSNLTVVDPERVVDSGSEGKGPRYNDDEVLLEGQETEQEEVEETADSDATASEESDQIEDSDATASEESEEDTTKPDIPFDRPTISEIKAEFPDIFKKFPSLKEAFFREVEFTKIFPTIEDAKEAIQENEAFTTLSDSALAGDPAPLLKSLEETDKKAFETFSMSFLPELVKKNSDLYSQVVTPLFQNLIRSVYAEKDDNSKNAALVIAEWIFGSDGEAVAKGLKSVAKNVQLSEEQKKLKTDKDQRLTGAFIESSRKVELATDKALEALILRSASFDPDKVFAPALRRMGTQEVIKKIKEQLKADKGHMTVMASRWKRARSNGYTSDDESKISATYLARAKSLIPGIASKVAEAMLGTKKRAAEKQGERAVVHPRQNNSGFSGGRQNGQVRTQKDYSKMSDLDILND